MTIPEILLRSDATDQIRGLISFVRENCCFGFPLCWPASATSALQNPSSVEYILFYSAFICIWGPEFQYLFPELSPVLEYIGLLLRHTIRKAFDISERLHQRHYSVHHAIQVSFCVFYGIHGFADLYSNEAYLHAYQIAEAQLAIYCARIPESFCTDTATTGTQNLFFILEYIDERHHAVLPEAIRSCLSTARNQMHDTLVSPLSPESASCLLERPGASTWFYQAKKTERCFCGWIYDTYPTLFDLFSYPIDHYIRIFHEEGEVAVTRGFGSKCLMPAYALAALGRPGIEERELRVLLFDFKILLHLVVSSFFWTLKDMSPELTHPSPFYIGHYRDFLLVVILNLVASWGSQGMGISRRKTEFYHENPRVFRRAFRWLHKLHGRAEEELYARFDPTMFLPTTDPSFAKSEEDESEEDDNNEDRNEDLRGLLEGL